MSFAVKFWGVRGSIACPSPEHLGFGGNTSCIEVMAGDERVILDSGTGIRNLGFTLTHESLKYTTLLLTHTHWDHINGFPFFSAIYRKDCTIRIMAGHLARRGGIRKILANQMSEPVFPVPLNALQARIHFEDFIAGDTFGLRKGITIRTAKLHHPDDATGYRIEYEGRSFCYITDTEHVPGKPDQNILGLVEGTDLMIYDSTYSDDEFPSKVGWGHSTWQEGIRLAKVANVKKLAIFHHDPTHDDAYMERVEASANALWPSAIVAREGMTIEL